MGYTLHDTNSTPMFAIFIKSQIYIYSYLTIGPDNFHLLPSQQKKAAYLIVLQSQVLHRYKQKSASTLHFKISVTIVTFGSQARIFLKVFFFFFPLHSVSNCRVLPSQMSYNWLSKESGTTLVDDGLNCNFWSLAFSDCEQPNC